MSQLLIAQFIGIIAVAISLSIFQVNNRDKMLIIGTIAALFYSVHFFMLGAFTGAALNLVGAARSYMFFKFKPNKRHTWVLLMFMVISAIATYLTWQGAISLFAFAGTNIGAFAAWHTKPKYIRRWALLAPPLWFVHNAVSGSYPGMIVEVIMFTSNLVGEYRFDFKHKKHLRRRLARVA